MAVYRHIHINYWQDGFVLDLTPEEKYFYIYLMTNSKTSQCGIYELHRRIIETETGYNRETVEKLLNRFGEYEKIVYCEETQEIFLKNWIKHNKVVSPKVKKCIEKELSNIKSKELINLFLNECDRYGYSIDTSNINFDMGIDRVSIPTPIVDDTLEYDSGEKEKQKENQNKEEKEKAAFNNVGMFKKLYEQNIGLVNGVAAEWLIDICETIDCEMFKRAIEIATDKGKCNKGYISGILKQWSDNNIRTFKDLKAYEVGIRNRGVSDGKYKDEYRKSKYATELENEDESIYRKPTPEQLEEARRSFDELRKGK